MEEVVIISQEFACFHDQTKWLPCLLIWNLSLWRSVCTFVICNSPRSIQLSQLGHTYCSSPRSIQLSQLGHIYCNSPLCIQLSQLGQLSMTLKIALLWCFYYEGNGLLFALYFDYWQCKCMMINSHMNTQSMLRYNFVVILLLLQYNDLIIWESTRWYFKQVTS